MESEPRELVLTTGHRLVPGGDSLEPQVQIVGPAGDIQLSIRLTPSGPVVRVQAATLELSASEALTLSAPQVQIRTTDGFQIQSGGTFAIEAREVRARTQDDIQMDGRTILLNCENATEDS